jgi:hypothetical protein
VRDMVSLRYGAIDDGALVFTQRRDNRKAA